MSGICSEEQQALRDTAAAYLAGHANARDGRDGDMALWQGIAGLGWPAVIVPEACGGLGLGLAEAAVLLEESGRQLTRSPLFTGVALSHPMLLRCATELACQRLLPALAEGRLISTVIAGPGLSPFVAPAALEIQARRAGDGWLLDGTAVQVLDGDTADVDVLYGYIASNNETGLFESAPAPVYTGRLADNLTAYYPLVGDAQDKRGSNHLIWTGDESYQQWDDGNQCAYFDGGEYLKNGSAIISARTATVCLRVRFDAASIKTSTGLFSQWVSATGRLTFYYSGATNRLRIAITGVDVTECSFTPVVGREYLIAFAMDNGKSKIYINGVSQTLTIDDASGVDIVNTPNMIGRYVSTASSWDFYGLIGEIRAYNAIALSDAESAELRYKRFESARVRDFSETIAAEASAYPADSCNIIMRLDRTNESELALGVRFETLSIFDAIRNDSAVLIEASDAAESITRRIYIDRSTQCVCATDGAAILSVGDAALRLAAADGRTLRAVYTGAILYVVDDAGNEWSAVGENACALSAAPDRLTVGSRRTAGILTDHFDGRILSYACLSSSSIASLNDCRRIARGL